MHQVLFLICCLLPLLQLRRCLWSNAPLRLSLNHHFIHLNAHRMRLCYRRNKKLCLTLRRQGLSLPLAQFHAPHEQCVLQLEILRHNPNRSLERDEGDPSWCKAMTRLKTRKRRLNPNDHKGDADPLVSEPILQNKTFVFRVIFLRNPEFRRKKNFEIFVGISKFQREFRRNDKNSISIGFRKESI